jgi:hypothetical protein
LTIDEVSKETKFGIKPDNKKMEAFGISRVDKVSKAFGFEYEIIMK